MGTWILVTTLYHLKYPLSTTTTTTKTGDTYKETGQFDPKLEKKKSVVTVPEKA